jgi:putative transcriptional regulator
LRARNAQTFSEASISEPISAPNSASSHGLTCGPGGVKRNQRRPDAQREDDIAENQRGVVTLDKKLFKRLVESMGQMDEIVRGVRAPSREFYVDAAKVKEIRAITGLSQPKFAKLLHVDVGTLRNWEQGRREPTGPAQALLRAIKNNPQAVLKALAA